MALMEACVLPIGRVRLSRVAMIYIGTCFLTQGQIGIIMELMPLIVLDAGFVQFERKIS